jgi:hypothetical protein
MDPFQEPLRAGPPFFSREQRNDLRIRIDSVLTRLTAYQPDEADPNPYLTQLCRECRELRQAIQLFARVQGERLGIEGKTLPDGQIADNLVAHCELLEEMIELRRNCISLAAELGASQNARAVAAVFSLSRVLPRPLQFFQQALQRAVPYFPLADQTAIAGVIADLIMPGSEVTPAVMRELARSIRGRCEFLAEPDKVKDPLRLFIEQGTKIETLETDISRVLASSYYSQYEAHFVCIHGLSSNLRQLAQRIQSDGPDDVKRTENLDLFTGLFAVLQTQCQIFCDLSRAEFAA